MAYVGRLWTIGRTLGARYRGYRRFQRGRAPEAPERFAAALIELGPTFVKLGQILSTRPDVLPAPYIAALEQLQEDQPPEPFAEIRRTLADELGDDFAGRLVDIDPEPVGAASLAQVHRATLGRDGRSVAVKVQRPGVEQKIRRDLDAIDHAMSWGRVLFPERLRRTNLAAFFDEFRRYTLRELDFASEGRVIDRFRDNLDGIPGVRLPEVHWSATTDRVLTMDWVEGMRVGEAATALPADTRRELVRSLVRVLMRMFVADGLFHADMHPGNIFFHPDGTFTLLDFGMYGELTASQRDRFILYLTAVVQRQIRRAFHHFEAQTQRLPGADEAKFFDRFSELAETFYSAPLSEMSFTRVYLEMMRAGYDYGFVFPRELMLHAKALTTAETLLFVLDPEVRFEEVARPIVARQVVEKAGSLDLLRRRITQFVPEFLFLGEILGPDAVDEDFDTGAADELADEVWAAALERMRDELGQGALWKAMLEGHFAAVMSETRWSSELDEILEQTWERYYELEPDLPVADSMGATFTTHLAVATLALFRTLAAHGIDPERAYQIIYDTGWRLYTKMGEPPFLLAAAYTRDNRKRLEIATDLFRTFPFDEPGYLWEDVESREDVVGFDCLRCPVAQFFERHDSSELCVRTWCQLDFPLAEKWGGYLEREGTIASGAERCDFRWHARDAER